MYEEVSANRQLNGRPSPLRAMVAVALGAFCLGGVAAWVAAGTPGAQRLVFFQHHAKPAPSLILPPAAPGPVPAGTVTEAHQTAQQVAQVAQQQGGLDERIAALEQRLARLDLQAQAAEGNAGRAEGLLIAFAARRTIERGAPLGYLQDQLKLRFGDARPNAVQAVIDDARAPVTIDQLAARLSGLAPALAKPPPGQGTFARLQGALAELFVVRRADAPSPAAASRIKRARLFLTSGRADLAAGEIRRLPNAAPAREWIADAERYAAAQQALDLLEMAAIEDPRGVRDAAGQPIAQPGVR